MQSEKEPRKKKTREPNELSRKYPGRLEKWLKGSEQIPVKKERIKDKLREKANLLPTTRKKGLAIVSLVCGVIGGYPWASTVSIVAVMCGHVALCKIRKDPNTYAGKGLAITGLVLGYLGLVLAIVLGIIRGVLKTKLGY